MGQAEKLSIMIEKIKIKQDCLFLFKKITEEFNFPFFNKPSLNLRKK